MRQLIDSGLTGFGLDGTGPAIPADALVRITSSMLSLQMNDCKDYVLNTIQ